MTLVAAVALAACSIVLVGVVYLLGYEVVTYGIKRNVPYVPSKDADLESTFLLLGDLTGKRFLDIGSGDGRVVIEAARRGADAEGVEINPRLVARAKRAADGTKTRAVFRQADILKESLAAYDIIFCYLLPDFLLKIEPKIIAECRPGTIIVTNTYSFPTLAPETQVGNVRLYRRPDISSTLLDERI